MNGQPLPVLDWQRRQPLASAVDASFLRSLPFWLSVSIHVGLIGGALACFFNPADFSVKTGRDNVSLYLVAAPAAPAPTATPPPPSPTKPETEPLHPEGAVPVLAAVATPAPPPVPLEPTPTETLVLQPAPPAPEPPRPHPVNRNGTRAPHPGEDTFTAIAVGGGKPGYLENPLPVYPEASRRARQEGTVLLRVLIDADGRISETSIQKSSGFLALDRAAVEALQRWRFRPASVGGIKMQSLVVIPVRFHLDD